MKFSKSGSISGKGNGLNILGQRPFGSGKENFKLQKGLGMGEENICVRMRPGLLWDKSSGQMGQLESK